MPRATCLGSGFKPLYCPFVCSHFDCCYRFLAALCFRPGRLGRSLPSPCHFVPVRMLGAALSADLTIVPISSSFPRFIGPPRIRRFGRLAARCVLGSKTLGRVWLFGASSSGLILVPPRLIFLLLSCRTSGSLSGLRRVPDTSVRFALFACLLLGLYRVGRFAYCLCWVIFCPFSFYLFG